LTKPPLMRRGWTGPSRASCLRQEHDTDICMIETKKKEDCRQRDTPPDYRSAKRCTQRGSRRADAEPHGDAAARTAAPDRRLLDVEAVPAQARLVRVNLRGASLLAKHHHALVARLARFCGAARRRKRRGCSAGAVDGEPAGGASGTGRRSRRRSSSAAAPNARLRTWARAANLLAALADGRGRGRGRAGRRRRRRRGICCRRTHPAGAKCVAEGGCVFRPRHAKRVRRCATEKLGAFDRLCNARRKQIRRR
jgi:hypothetical protein